ncbi:hypothetical protein [Cognatishimia sp.]|uniref:hypothetical protein n=1 Tax=Cognatishimia sp. TaxID=2211648 RepID=UPI003512E290
MIQKWAIPSLCLIVLGACTDGDDFASSNSARPASQELVDLAAPGQDLSQVRVDPVTGCFVYRYRGPIETTYLPVRTPQGNPICTRAQS